MDPHKEKASIGTFLDNNSLISINKDGKLKLDIKTNRYKIAKYLQDKFNLKIYQVGINYRITCARGTFSKIYEEYKDYFYINKDRYLVGYEYAIGERFSHNKDGRSTEYKIKYHNLLKTTKKNELSGNEPLLYKINYFDSLPYFSLTKSMNFFSPFLTVSTQSEKRAQFISNFLNKSIYKNGKSLYIRLNKQETINFCERLTDYVFDNSLYALIVENKECYKEDFAEKFKAIKFEKPLDENLTSRTVVEKIKLAEMAKSLKEETAREQLKRINKEKQEKIELEREARIQKAAKRIEQTILKQRERKKIAIENKIKKQLLISEKIKKEKESGVKVCKTCKMEKSLDNFGENKSNRGGLKHHCKTCEYKKYVIPKLTEMARRTRKWQRENPEKVKEMRKLRRQKPQERIKSTIKLRLWGYLKDRCTGNFKQIIGCTPKELKSYIESLWDDTMSWENYGKEWEIDHIIPCAAFDMEDKIQLHQCWNYRNLRPLDKNENWNKSDTLPTGQSARTLKRDNPQLLREIVGDELIKLGIIEEKPVFLDLTV